MLSPTPNPFAVGGDEEPARQANQYEDGQQGTQARGTHGREVIDQLNLMAFVKKKTSTQLLRMKSKKINGRQQLKHGEDATDGTHIRVDMKLKIQA